MLAPASASLSQGAWLSELLYPDIHNPNSPDGALTVGDKRVSNWGNWNAIGNYTDPAWIWITFSQSGPDQYCLEYQGSLTAKAGEFLDMTWSYDIETLSGAPLIKDATLSLQGFGTSDGATISLSEALREGSLAGPLVTPDGTMAVTEVLPDDAIVFNAVPKVSVFKNLGLNGNLGTAHLSYFKQCFSQVPEASTFALFGLGLAGMGLFRRRKR
jgi:hypothetical protein